MMASENSSSSVWAAEHGSSSADRSADKDEPAGANAGHRFRIHGRLGEELPEQLAGDLDTDQQDGERLRVLLAQATEIDLADVHIEVGGKTVELWGTVADDGERLQLEELVDRLTGTKPVTSRLRPRNPVI